MILIRVGRGEKRTSDPVGWFSYNPREDDHRG